MTKVASDKKIYQYVNINIASIYFEEHLPMAASGDVFMKP